MHSFSLGSLVLPKILFWNEGVIYENFSFCLLPIFSYQKWGKQVPKLVSPDENGGWSLLTIIVS